MIREIPFQYNLENRVGDLKFQSELSKIVKHYDSVAISEEAEAVKILMGKINIPTVFNPRSAQLMIFDSCLWHISRMLDDVKPAQYSIDTV